jgi:hypothetical protein
MPNPTRQIIVAETSSRVKWRDMRCHHQNMKHAPCTAAYNGLYIINICKHQVGMLAENGGDMLDTLSGALLVE